MSPSAFRTGSETGEEVSDDDRRALEELLAYRVTGRPLPDLEADRRAGPIAWRTMIATAVADIVDAGWSRSRRPATPPKPNPAYPCPCLSGRLGMPDRPPGERPRP